MAVSEPEVHRLLIERMQALEAQFHDEFPERVRRVLRTALLTDRTGSDDIAALFSMTLRTMNRRLSTYGLSFRNLVDEGRYEIARRLIDTDMSVSQVAALLDFDASSFVRAFQRWSGKSPSQWRSSSRRGRNAQPRPERRTAVPELSTWMASEPDRTAGRAIAFVNARTSARCVRQCGR